MSELCLECGEKGDTTLNHPDWPFDVICSECHNVLWEEWIEVRLSEYEEATGIDYVDAHQEDE